MRRELTAERLRAMLRYDQATGVFTRLVQTASNARVGDTAGTLNGQGYLRISIDKFDHRAHRLAWLYVNGAWPDGEIDHINGDRGDNRIANLRVVTRAVNMQNQRAAPKGSASGLLGVHPYRRKWSANITIGGKTRRVGVFESKEEAHTAYVLAKRELHEACAI